jgi:hypothetical protein
MGLPGFLSEFFGSFADQVRQSADETALYRKYGPAWRSVLQNIDVDQAMQEQRHVGEMERLGVQTALDRERLEQEEFGTEQAQLRSIKDRADLLALSGGKLSSRDLGAPSGFKPLQVGESIEGIRTLPDNPEDIIGRERAARFGVENELADLFQRARTGAASALERQREATLDPGQVRSLTRAEAEGRRVPPSVLEAESLARERGQLRARSEFPGEEEDPEDALDVPAGVEGNLILSVANDLDQRSGRDAYFDLDEVPRATFERALGVVDEMKQLGRRGPRSAEADTEAQAERERREAETPPGLFSRIRQSFSRQPSPTRPGSGFDTERDLESASGPDPGADQDIVVTHSSGTNRTEGQFERSVEVESAIRLKQQQLGSGPEFLAGLTDEERQYLEALTRSRQRR